MDHYGWLEEPDVGRRSGHAGEGCGPPGFAVWPAIDPERFSRPSPSQHRGGWRV